MRSRLVTRSSFLPLIVLLASCGGGGGGDPPPAAPPATTTKVTPDVQALTLQRTVAQPAPSMSVLFTVTNAPPVGLYAGVEWQGEAILAAHLEVRAGNFLEAVVDLPLPGDFPPGKLSGEIAVAVCLDDKCAKHAEGSPIVVPVDMTIVGLPPVTVTADPASWTASAVRGVANAPPQTFTVNFATPVAGTPHVSATIAGSSISHALVQDPTSTGTTVEVALQSAAILPYGTHSSSVTIDACYTPSCVNRVFAAPLVIPIAYNVNAAPSEAELPAFSPVSQLSLAHNVVDAEYSAALESVVMAASYPSNAVYVYDVGSHTERRIELSLAPTAVSVSPDGKRVAVGHDSFVTYVDLTGAGVPAAKVLNASAEVFDLVLDGRGRVHVFPRVYDGVGLRSIDVATNVETISPIFLRAMLRARLHSSGDYLYIADTEVTSPIESLDIRVLPVKYVDDPVLSDNPQGCGDFWLSSSGTLGYTGCGALFQTAPASTDDLKSAGSLDIFASGYGSRIGSLSHSATAQEILTLSSSGLCERGFLQRDCYSRVTYHDGVSLERETMYSVGPIKVGNVDYPQIGRFVFHDSTGGRRLLISRLEGIEDAAAEYYLSEF